MSWRREKAETTTTILTEIGSERAESFKFDERIKC
jgi:hypothetical protein